MRASCALHAQGMGERVHELMRLNAALVDSNNQLQHRLIQAALGDEDSDVPATARAASVESDVLARRYSELQQSLAAEEERRREAFTRRLKLHTKGQRLVEAAAKGPEEARPEETAAIKAREAQRREEREVARLALQVCWCETVLCDECPSETDGGAGAGAGGGAQAQAGRSRAKGRWVMPAIILHAHVLL